MQSRHSHSRQRFSPALRYFIACALMSLAVLVVVSLNPPTSMPPAPDVTIERPRMTPQLSQLSAPPDWTELQPFQDTITRPAFERLLNEVFTNGQGWQPWIAIDDQQATIHTGTPDAPLRLTFAPSTAAEKLPPRHWRTAADMPPAAPHRILEGVHIAIDPGHIGGTWARMEERWLKLGDNPPVCEGDMTLLVAQILKPELEAFGAKVTLLRSTNEPLTPLRPADFLDLARKQEPPFTESAKLQKTAERLFYRTAEIHERGRIVNEAIKPDLVLCLHFNAESWKDPRAPTLVEHSHFHMLVNGCYTPEELALVDQRFEMLHKLLQRTHETEATLSAAVASSFVAASKLPPYHYPPTSSARKVDGNPFVWARNLLANRLYHCPVVFLEPYVMNCRADYLRMQAGDYHGTRIIDGKEQISIFREYAFGVRDGLVNHYLQQRAKP